MAVDPFMIPRFNKMTTMRAQAAFTLIELLTVIAIIGLMAGLVIGLSGLATTKSRASRMQAEHQRLVTAIESYKAELGNYPPDNQDTNSPNRLGMNSLFYELSGATFRNTADGGEFETQNASEIIKAKDLKAAFGVRGVDNSARSKRDIPYAGISFKQDQYKELEGFADAEILVNPLKGPKEREIAGKGNRKLNPWLYDASSTNRHNQDGFDLWAEYLNKDRTVIIGNWKE